MSARPGPSWQTSLADLTLILFMITAAAVTQQPAKPARSRTEGKAFQAQAAPAPSPQTEPLSLYIAAPDAPPLGEWLAQQAADPRQQLTITARYTAAPGAQEQAMAQAGRLLTEAGAQGRAARMVVEPGPGPTTVALAYDVPGGTQAGSTQVAPAQGASPPSGERMARELHNR